MRFLNFFENPNEIHENQNDNFPPSFDFENQLGIPQPYQKCQPDPNQVQIRPFWYLFSTFPNIQIGFLDIQTRKLQVILIQLSTRNVPTIPKIPTRLQPGPNSAILMRFLNFFENPNEILENQNENFAPSFDLEIN